MEDAREAVPPSCKACRKRKAKCDRSQPCINCIKSGIDCTYERILRTPLTRKHLTDVERELARTKQLLRQYESNTPPQAPVHSDESDPQTRRTPNTRSTSHNEYEDTSGGNELPLNAQARAGTHSAVASGSSRNAQHTTHMLARESSNHNTSHPRMPNVARDSNNGNSQPDPAFSMETPPTGDFDWDERFRSNNQFTDGMAALTETSSRGYMGVASGAALLRLANNDSVDPAVEAENGRVDEERTTPLAPALYSLAQLENFVDAYFSTYHVSYPIVHEASFRAQFMELIPRPGGNAWQVLLHIIATIGAFAASETAPEADLALFEAAKARMSIDLLETGNVTLVQALALMSNYVQKRNKPNSGYNYLGLAKRVALGIGLHKEFQSWHSKPLMLEIRRRVWYCLYIFDFGAIVTFSRPLDLPRTGVEVQLPLNVSDGDITASTKTWPAETEDTTLYTHVRCQARFHLATAGIYERLISSYPSAENMLRLDNEHLEPWLQSLPPYFKQEVPQIARYRLCHSILQWRWRNLRILMYRPYLIRYFMARIQDPHHETTDSEDRAVRRCLDAAAETIDLITTYWPREKQNVLTCWYALYFLFQALLIPVICLRNDPFNESANAYRQQILSTLSVMSSMTRLNSAAERCYNTVFNLCGAFLGDNTPPTVMESPQTQLNALQSFMWPIMDPQFMGGYETLQETAAYDFMTNFGNF